MQHPATKCDSPRVRGGQPCAAPSLACHSRFSPHARGSTRQLRTKAIADAISPACAGVNPRSWRRLTARKNSPRMRGDQPNQNIRQMKAQEFSPHTRGSTPPPQSFRRGYRIHPACAGVNLVLDNGGAHDQNSPRMHGDQPLIKRAGFSAAGFSPHVRGSTWSFTISMVPLWILPACAGVNLPTDRLLCSYAHSPRMRGGQPTKRIRSIQME